jgi:glycosyltransferase involved in cell wall biosynthesis
MIRVLFISNRLPPEGLGGAEAVALSIAEGCSRAGATVAVMGIGGSPVWEGHRPAARGDEIQASKLSWYRLNPTRLSAIQGGEVVPVLKRIAAHIVDLMPTYRRSVAESVITDIQPDLVVTNNVRGIGMGTVVACARSNAKWIHIPHDVQLLTPSGLWYLDGRPSTLWHRRQVRFSYQRWMRRLFKQVDYVFAATEFILEAHLARGFFPAAGAEVLRLPSVQSGATPRVRRRAKPPAPGDVESPLHVAMVGRLTDHKGIAWALSAICRVRTPIVVDVCGTGDQAEEMRLLAESAPPSVTVNLHGHLAPTQRDQVLAAADLLVVPSLAQECFPLVIEEATDLGLPSIASRSGGIPELVRSEWLFAPGDSADFLRVLGEFDRLRPEATHIEQSPVPQQQFVDRLLARGELLMKS